MVIAYHLVAVAYGHWLPNDPRGSMSQTIRCDVLKEIGELHHGRKRIQPASRDIREFYANANALLKHPLLEFEDDAISVIADLFAQVIAFYGYTCYACAILRDHFHILIRKHRDISEQMLANLLRESHLKLRSLGLRDLEHPVWGGPGWKVFLETPDDIRRTIKYIEQNPIKMRRPAQMFPFVKPYNGWGKHMAR